MPCLTTGDDSRDDGQVSSKRNEVLAFDDPDWKPSRSTKAPESQVEEIHRCRTVPSTSSSKLEELRLAFGTLAREIQEGVEGDEKGEGFGISPCSRAIGDGRAKVIISSDPVETKESSSSSSSSSSNWSIESGRTHLPEAGATEDCNGLQGGTRQRWTFLAFRSMPSVDKKPDVTSKAQDTRSLESSQEDTCAENLVRIKAAAYTAGRDTAEVDARHARQELKRVYAELESERGSRQAVQRALQEVQRMAEEALVERERLANVVKTFEERSQKEPAAESESLKKRVWESERSLVKARLQIEAKARELVEVLERAADLEEALKKERAARVAAVDEQKNLTRDLRACLRDRAKAEEVASAASKALQQSKAQRESLTQRLEVLRSANKRLDKKVAAAAPGANSHSGVGSATGVHDRLVEARARLRTLSTYNLIANDGDGGRGRGSTGDFLREDPTKAAVERALKTALVDKKWEEKLRDAEKRGEAYRSAALSAETEIQRVVKEKEELAEMNRILSQRLADFSGDESSSNCKQDTESVAAPVATMRAERSPLSREDNLCSSQSEMKSRDCSHDNYRDDETRAEVSLKTLPREVPAEFSPTDRSLQMSEACGAAPPRTATTPPITSNDTHEERHLLRDSKSASALEGETVESDHNGIKADRKATHRCAPRTVRSNSLDASERPALFRSCCTVRPCSANENFPSNRRAPCIGHEKRDDAMFNRLLTDSRRLRVDVLDALRNWPRHEGAQGNHVANRPDVPLRAPESEKGVENASAVDIDARARPKSASITPVPIAVLLRLCDRSARLAKCKREDNNTMGIGGKGTLPAGLGEGDILGATRIKATLDSEEPTKDDQLLPPGVSAALAQQVRCAVSRGDESGFLQIIERCGSTARGGIAHLLAIKPS